MYPYSGRIWDMLSVQQTLVLARLAHIVLEDWLSHYVSYLIIFCYISGRTGKAQIRPSLHTQCIEIELRTNQTLDAQHLGMHLEIMH